MNRNIVLTADTFNYGQYYYGEDNDDESDDHHRDNNIMTVGAYESTSSIGYSRSSSGGASLPAGYSTSNSNNSDNATGIVTSVVPSKDVLLKRQMRQNNILNETAFHRCVHSHDGMSDTCRNIVYILHDRTIYGSRAVTLHQKRLPLPPTLLNGRRRRRPTDGTNASSRTTSPAAGNRCKDGERSPSTVFDSPVSTTQIPDEGGDITTTIHQQQQQQHQLEGRTPSLGYPLDVHIGLIPHHQHQQQQQQQRQSDDDYEEEDGNDYDNDQQEGKDNGCDVTANQDVDNCDHHPNGIVDLTFPNHLHPDFSRSFAEDVGGPDRMQDIIPTTIIDPHNRSNSSNNKNKKISVKTTAISVIAKKNRRITYPLRIVNEIRMFGEYSLATKYNSSFLNHLGGNDKLDDNGNRPVSSNAVSTISVAFSVDGKTMASTHGDHTVKISYCETGRLLQSLEGHPRTPWTVKYHPINPHILASGCLGHQVRVWNWVTKTCLQMIRLEFAIISLSFHPSGTLLAIANGTRLHFWGVDDDTSSEFYRKKTTRMDLSVSPSSVAVPSFVSPSVGWRNSNGNGNGITANVTNTPGTRGGGGQQGHFFGTSLTLPPSIVNSTTNNVSNRTSLSTNHQLHNRTNNYSTTSGSGVSNNGGTNSSINRSSVLTELDQKHMLRCVHFPPGGTTLIIGGVNPPTEHHHHNHPHDPRHRGNGAGAAGAGGRGASGGAGGGRIGGGAAGIGNGGSSPTGMSFYLRLWDFDLEKALELPTNSSTHNITSTASMSSMNNNSASIHVNNIISSAPPSAGYAAGVGSSSAMPYNLNSITMTMARRAISNPRTFVPRALLYNDGGFDVSPDGKTLCACAEYWLPDGVSNASELLHREEIAYDEEVRVHEECLAQMNDLKEADYALYEDTSNDGHGTGDDFKVQSTVGSHRKDNVIPSSQSNTANAAKAASALNHRGALPSDYISRFNPPNNYNNPNVPSNFQSWSYRDGMEHPVASQPTPGTPAALAATNSFNSSNNLQLATSSATAPRTPAASSPEPGSSFIPLTPPITIDPRMRNLSPPPPPGSQAMGRHGAFGARRQTVSTMGMEPLPPHTSSNLSAFNAATRALSTPPGAPPPPPPTAPGVSVRPPHPLSFISTWASTTSTTLSSSGGSTTYGGYSHNANDVPNLFRGGRYIPHVVTISLDTDPFPESLEMKVGRGKAYGAVAKGYRPRLGQLLEACPLDANKASAVTCVKFSPSTDFCLIGYGVREPAPEGSNNNNSNNANGGTNTTGTRIMTNFHPVTAIYRIKGGMTHISTMLSGDDDVNIARFHPDSGHSFVYGTKQGRVRVLSKRPWNFYDD